MANLLGSGRKHVAGYGATVTPDFFTGSLHKLRSDSRRRSGALAMLTTAVQARVDGDDASAIAGRVVSTDGPCG